MVLEANLGERLTLAIDPLWPHQGLWQHPLGRVLRFTFLDWESGINEAVTPNYVNTEVVGRAESFKAYLNTPNRSISLTFLFRVQGTESTEIRTAIEREVIQPARFLDALKYPVFNESQGISYAPPPVILKVGSLFTGRCVLTAGDPQWRGPWETEQLLPHACEMSCTFEVVRQFRTDLSYFPSGSSGGPISGVWE